MSQIQFLIKEISILDWILLHKYIMHVTVEDNIKEAYLIDHWNQRAKHSSLVVMIATRHYANQCSKEGK